MLCEAPPRLPHLPRRLPLPALPRLRPVPLRAAAWAVVALSVLWAGEVVAAPLSGGEGWADAPRAVWWYGGETEPRTTGQADAYCPEDGVCTAYGQGMAFSIEGAGSRVALPLVSTGLLADGS